MTAISVVIPAHNAAATLDATANSVRGQTHEQLEILIVDDGSTDGTLEIARRHAEQDPRVRVITQPNGGVASARNRGLAEASTELVALVDADDVWHPEKIERQLRVIEKNVWRAKISDEEFRELAGAIVGSAAFKNWDDRVMINVSNCKITVEHRRGTKSPMSNVGESATAFMPLVNGFKDRDAKTRWEKAE